ncbi:MAG TPA: DUF4402 domain-containing protein [Thermoanaerobaculia bacterium]|nr:DUF4402 domain-containing protein [Thermoanaerobaculia bacterium]
MKKLLISAAALAVLALTNSANAQAASANGTATAKVLTPIGISAGANLNFGTIASGAALGTVVITPAGARSVTGGVGAVTDGANAPTAGVFTVTGAAGYGFAITLPVSATITSGANNMTVNTFASTPSGTGTLTAGTATVNVGATLNVAANQAAGAYTGTYPVTVNYN